MITYNDPEFGTESQAALHEAEMTRLAAKLAKILGKNDKFDINDVLDAPTGLPRQIRFTTKDLQLLAYAVDAKGKYGVVLRI